MEERLRDPLVTATLYEDIEHVPLLIHRSPQMVMLPLNRAYPFIEVPIYRQAASADDGVDR
jgi:hypothetical protein